MTTFFVSLNQFNTKESRLEFIIYIPVIPPMFIHYPYFHPNRSRFFNTATLFHDIVTVLNEDIFNYLQHTGNIYGIQKFNPFDLAYNNYVKWEESGGKELTLPGFFLTNRQMFWVVIGHRFYLKVHSHNKIDESFNLFHRNLHVFFKIMPSFQKDFNCSAAGFNLKEVLNLKNSAENLSNCFNYF